MTLRAAILCRATYLLLSFLFVTGLSSCEKTVEQDMEVEYPEYIVFGRYTNASWCSGETCNEKFRISSEGLFEDIADQSPISGQLSNGVYDLELSKSDYDLIIAILNKKSYEPLLNTSAPSLGTLWEDNSHFYFEYKSATIHRSWLIDGTFDGSVNSTLQSLLVDLGQMIQIAQF
jgi:hypothetical protein